MVARNPRMVAPASVSDKHRDLSGMFYQETGSPEAQPMTKIDARIVNPEAIRPSQ